MKSLNTPKGTKKIGTEAPLKSPRKESIPRPSAIKTKAAHVSGLLEEMRADLSPILPQQFGNFPLDESMLCSKISADHLGNLEHTHFNFLSDENLNNLISASPGGPYRRLLEEYSILKKELELKSGLVERIMKENKNLRRELEEFLSTVEEARSHIDVELKECTNRIIDLEAEIQDLRSENKSYKEQLQKNAASLADASDDNGKVIAVLEEEVDGYYESSRKGFEDFYFRLNEQIVEFMDSSKKQYQDFQKNLHDKMTEVTASSTPATMIKNIPAPISTSRNSSMRRDPDVASPARSVKSGLNNRLSNSRTQAAPTKSRLSSVDSKTSPKLPTSTSATTNKKILSKQSANHSSTELHHQGLSYNSSKRKLTLTNSSIGLLETESGNLSGFTVPDSKGNLLGNSTVSPKSTILTAKMRSDALLQEMKRKLAEVTGSHA